jgi:UDP-N-acetylmuramate-alanine ligase
VTSRLPLMAALEQAPRLAAASLPDHQSAVRWAIRVAKPGDLILTLGAGDVTGIGPEIVEALSERMEHADA